MSEASERENKIKAALISVGIHSALLLVLFFVVAWRAPGPPSDEIGVVLNYGVDDQGSGDIQPTEPVGTENAKEETPEETKPDPVPQQVIPKETEEKDAEDVVGKEESPVTVKKDEKKEEAKMPVKPVEKPVEQKPKEEVKNPDPNGSFNPDASKTGDGKEKGGKEGKPGGEGDDKGKAGDKGDPRGSYEKGAYTGNPGGGNGGPPLLDLNGWDWDNIPNPKIPDNETSGRVVYLIEVDDNGDLIKYERETSSVSAATERACVSALQKLTFSKKAGAKVPPITKGRITFIIRAQ